MLVISTRKFREKQGMYFGMAKSGEDIIVKSRENGSFKLVPITEDDTLISREQLDEIIERGLKNIKDGKTKMYTMEELRIKMGL